MRANLIPLSLFFVLFPPVVRAQESPSIQPEELRWTTAAQNVPAAQESPPAKSQNPQEEHPRLFWIFPTYTVSETKTPVSLTSSGKFHIFLKDKTDPYTYGSVAFEAGLGQASNSFSGYGQGAAGYGKRFGAGLADEVSGGFFETFAFPSLFHQDPRYFRQGSGPFKSRLAHALVRPVLTRKDSGGRAFNWSGLLGRIAASGLANAYYPHEDRGAGATFSRVAIGIPFSLVDEVFNEFGPDLEKKILGKK